MELDKLSCVAKMEKRSTVGSTGDEREKRRGWRAGHMSRALLSGSLRLANPQRGGRRLRADQYF